MIPPKFREYAKAFLNIAKKDNIRAKRALELKDYPECFFYSQQSVEKKRESYVRSKINI